VWSNPEAAPHMVINDWWPTYVTPYDYLSLLECGKYVHPGATSYDTANTAWVLMIKDALKVVKKKLKRII
jgi:hypothetical protein